MLKVYDNMAAASAEVSTDQPLDQILIENLVLEAFIGVFKHEYDAPQKVRFDVKVYISPLPVMDDHSVSNVVRYDHIISDIKTRLANGHIDLIETLAEDISVLCLNYDRAQRVDVQVMKLEAIGEAQGVGVKITRLK